MCCSLGDSKRAHVSVFGVAQLPENNTDCFSELTLRFMALVFLTGARGFGWYRLGIVVLHESVGFFQINASGDDFLAAHVFNEGSVFFKQCVAGCVGTVANG